MGCERMWSCIHVMWSVAYVACGAAQLVAGIFFILGVPSWVLGCNLLTGSYNILMGIGVGMVACCGQVTPRRQETLLYMTVSILMANVANIVVTEYGFYHIHIVKLMEEHQYNELIKYACFGARGTAALILLISFLDSQLAFCSMQSAAVARAGKKQPKNLYYHHHRGGPGPLGANGSHEQVSDIEYIIPRQKSSKSQQQQQQQQQVYNAYSQSWVFDADSNNTTSTLVNNPNGSLGGHSSSGSRGDRDRYNVGGQQLPQPQQQQQQKKHPHQHHLLTSYQPHQHQQHQYYDGLHSHGGDVVRGKQLIAKGNGIDCGLVVTDNRHVKGHLIDNPVVQIDEAVSITDSTNSSNGDRKICHMKSFSRSASPVVLSACSSQLSLNQTIQHTAPPHINNGTAPGPVYECLNHHLTTRPDTTFRARLTSAKEALSSPSHQPQTASHHQVVMVRGASTEAATPQAEKVQYACLMKELQNAIVNKSNKATAATIAPSSSTNSKSSSRQESSSIASSKNSDAEFSKELEAALQLIQDLESPNTIDTTPSEQLQPAAWRNSSSIHSHSDSEKTLSATGSLTELSSVSPTSQQKEQPQPQQQASRNGKGTRIFVPNITTSTTNTQHTIQNSLGGHSGGSQSTSGYSSPTRGNKSSTHTPVWSTTSSINGSTQDIPVAQANSPSPNHTHSPLTYTIHNTKSTAVISLFAQDPTTKPKSITLVNIMGDTSACNLALHERTTPLLIAPPPTNTVTGKENDSTKHKQHSRTDSSASSENRSSVGSSNIWTMKSLLRKKKTTPPKLCPELEEAIIKSESLAYLSELELVARHERNTSIQRQIEQKVHQQLSIPRTSSNC